jgi:hypothetical protein
METLIGDSIKLDASRFFGFVSTSLTLVVHEGQQIDFL